jgi:hypothetical protein
MTYAPLSRRRFVLGTIASLSYVEFGAPVSGAPSKQLPPIVMYDATLDASNDFALAASSRGTDCHAIADDRFRFARAVLTSASQTQRIAAISTYADFLILTGTLEEARYRLVGHHFVSAASQHCTFGQFAGWTAELHAAGRFWPQALSRRIFGTAGLTARQIADSSPVLEPATTVSWLMKPRSV